MSLSVTLPDDLASRVAGEAERRNVSAAELAVSALAERFPPEADGEAGSAPVSRKSPAPEVSDEARAAMAAFIGSGASDGKHRAADSEEYMRTHGFVR